MYKSMILLTIILILFLIGCGESSPNIEECFKIAKLTPIKYYKIINSDTSGVIGDYYESHPLIISRDDYLRIEKEIKSKPFFIEYDSISSIKHARGNRNSTELKIIEVAYSIKDEIYYEYFNVESWEEVGVSLQNDTILNIGYSRE